VAIIQLSDDKDWQQRRKKKRFPSHFMSQHAQPFHKSILLKCPEAWVWQYIPGKRPLASPKKENVTRLQLDIFSAFYVLSYLSDYSKRSYNISETYGMCTQTEWVPIERFNINCCLEKKQKTIAGVGVLRRASKGFWGISFLVSIRFLFVGLQNQVWLK